MSTNYILILTIIIDSTPSENQIHIFNNFQDLVSTPFYGEINAICWKSKLKWDFYEIEEKIEIDEIIVKLELVQLRKLQLRE